MLNQRFGCWTVIAESPNRATNGSRLWLCRCDCGREMEQRKDSLHKNLNGCRRCANNEPLDIRDQRFGRWVAVRDVGPKKTGRQHFWECLCDCGQVATVSIDSLTTGRSQSCGCFNRERVAELLPQLMTQHGHTAGGTTSPTYNSWSSMIQRCTNPSNISYPRYGAQGIRVCERWMTFEGFLTSMGERPEGTSLSRFGDVGNYEPGNCAWHTRKQQREEARKKRLALAVTNEMLAAVA
jgi:hypothetical protein